MKRWYEKHTVLSRNIDLMMDMDEERRDYLVRGIMNVIRRYSPTLLDDFVHDFPLDIQRKRWYDKDPYLWLTFNGLQYGSDKLISQVESYLETERGQLQHSGGATAR